MIKKLFSKWACKHKWDIMHETNHFDSRASKIRNEQGLEDLPVSIRRTLVCNECGKIKQIKL